MKGRRNPQRPLWFNGATGSNLKFMILGHPHEPSGQLLSPETDPPVIDHPNLDQIRLLAGFFDSFKVITRLPCGFTGAEPGRDHTFAPAVRRSDSFPAEPKTEAG